MGFNSGFKGLKCVEMYVCSLHVPSWRGEGQLYLFFYHFPSSACHLCVHFDKRMFKIWQNIDTVTIRVHVLILCRQEQRNILHEIRKRKANCIGHILLRNCLLQRVIEGKIKGEIEVTERRGRRRRKLLDDLKERKGYSHLKEEALDRTMWRARFGGGFGPVVRQTTK